MDISKAKQLIKLNRQTYDYIANEFSNTRKHLWQEMKSFGQYIKDKNKILDLGCGNGRLIKTLEDKQVEYTGLDNSYELIKIAKKKYPNHHFRVGNLSKLPFGNNNFDLIFAIASIHHIPSKKLREQTAAEIRRVLKNKGRAIISVWNLNQDKYSDQIKKSQKEHSFLEKGDWLKPWGEKNSKLYRYYHRFSQKELENLFKNFKIIEKKYNSYNYWLTIEK
jgi:ubiquinone/menaquinone biosynthesis C-methylase UbiE